MFTHRPFTLKAQPPFVALEPAVFEPPFVVLELAIPALLVPPFVPFALAPPALFEPPMIAPLFPADGNKL